MSGFDGKTFGASSPVFGSDGQQLQFVAMSDKICDVCQEATGGTLMGVLRDRQGVATIACPNCGDMFPIPSDEIKKTSL